MGSSAVERSSITRSSSGVVASALTLLCAGVFACVGCVGCLRCHRCIACVACVDCVDCIGCVGCVGLRGVVGRVDVHA